MITPDHPLLQLPDLIDQVWIEVLPETVKRGAPRWYSEKTLFKVYVVSLPRRCGRVGRYGGICRGPCVLLEFDRVIQFPVKSAFGCCKISA